MPINNSQWLAITSVLVWAAIAAIKSKKLDLVLQKLSLPPIPDRLLPWASMILGGLAGMADSLNRGTPLAEAVSLGLVAGASAIAGQELATHPVVTPKDTP